MIGEPDLVARGPLRKMNVEAMTHLKKKMRKNPPTNILIHLKCIVLLWPLRMNYIINTFTFFFFFNVYLFPLL